MRGPFFFLADAEAGGPGASATSRCGRPARTMRPTSRPRLRPRCATPWTASGPRRELRLAEEEPIEFWTCAPNTGMPRRLADELPRDRGPRTRRLRARPRLQRAPCRDLVRPARSTPCCHPQPPAARHGDRAHVAEIYSMRCGPGRGAQLIGYEDSRTRFLGPRHPRPARPRARGGARVDDEGSLYTFDPAASLSVAVDLAPSTGVELLFVTGRGRDEQRRGRDRGPPHGRPATSARRSAPCWPQTPPSRPAPPCRPNLAVRLQRGRGAASDARDAAALGARAGQCDGFGTVVSNEGEIHSFNANARQNALTPFRFESGAALQPGQLIYVVDLASGETDTAGFVPFRRPDATHEVDYGSAPPPSPSGAATLKLDLTVFVLPDAPADVRLLTIRNPAARRSASASCPISTWRSTRARRQPRQARRGARRGRPRRCSSATRSNDFHDGWAFAATSLTAAVTETVRTRFLGAPGRDLTDPVMVETGCPDGQRGRRPPRRRLRGHDRGAGRGRDRRRRSCSARPPRGARRSWRPRPARPRLGPRGAEAPPAPGGPSG